MDTVSIKYDRIKIFGGILFIMMYLLFLLFYPEMDNYTYISSSSILLFSWIGLIITVVYIIIWARIYGKFLSPFIIFLCFVAVFNFGQCFLWAFGIHSKTEIGRGLIFSSIYADNLLILKSQLLFIISFIALNTGALISLKKKAESKNLVLNKDNNTHNTPYKIVYITSVIISCVSIPITMYTAIKRLIFSQMYSYHDLYYGSISSFFDNPIMSIGCQLFIISLIGLLIGSKYKKKTVYFVYFVFLVYSVITLLGGDRGEWLKPGVFLFWMHITFYKPIETKKLLFLSIMFILFLWLINPIINMRNSGLSLDSYFTGLFNHDSGILKSMLLEFGNTMGISIILLKNNLISPYGNTYFMSIPTVLGTGIANRVFGFNYIQIHTWFPLHYLKISYGTDFSIIGEALLNYGAILTPLILLIEGILFGPVFNNSYSKVSNPLIMCLSINIMINIIGIARSTFWIFLNNSVYSTSIFIFIYVIIKIMISTKNNNNAITNT